MGRRRSGDVETVAIGDSSFFFLGVVLLVGGYVHGQVFLLYIE